jgi:NADH:ubiquinone oxidoreductase 24 kD subunit
MQRRLFMNEQCACCATVEITEEQMLEQLEDVLTEYREKPGALIPILQTAQTMFGYLPRGALRRIATVLDKPFSEVAGVVGFYSFFSTVPRGKYLVRVCLGTACYVRGGKQVLGALKKHLAIDIGETTQDKIFSLEIGRCFGACGLAPVIMVNDDVYQRVKPSKVNDLLNTYRANEAAAYREEKQS